MSQPQLSKNSHIIIVGAGVFGLSNALHLAQNGYKNITVFDRLDMHKNHYTFLEGADTASADLNKIFRAQYASDKHYQDLAFKAFDIWQQWNLDIELLPQEEASKYKDLKLLELCGMFWLDDVISKDDLASRESFAKDGLTSLTYDINSANDLRRANAAGFGPKMKYINDLKTRINNLEGFLDTSAGMLYASRACQYVNYLCRSMGVEFIFGEQQGTFQRFIYDEEDGSTIKGIVTKDNKHHLADLTVVSCGPWSTSIVEELDGINEATSGNVLIFKIPKHRKDLQVKYSAKNFPIVGWRWDEEREHEYLSGMYMFPYTPHEGYMKIIVRQTKYTNPVKFENGKVISIPMTANSNPPFKYLTKHIVDQVKQFMKIFFPDLVDAGIQFESKVLWYTDTINNDFIYDYVPGKKGLFVACGGSGHGFKMLPVLGQFLVDRIEQRENIYTRVFRWRDPRDFEGKDVNGLKEKLASKRRYSIQEMSSERDMAFTSASKL